MLVFFGKKKFFGIKQENKMLFFMIAFPEKKCYEYFFCENEKSNQKLFFSLSIDFTHKCFVSHIYMHRMIARDTLAQHSSKK